MTKLRKIVYSKHAPDKKCGVAYFASILAKHLSAHHIQSFHGFTHCDELYINMDILELDESEVSSLLNFMNSHNAKKKIIIMHDYRFSYLEDKLVNASDLVINLSGEPALIKVAGKKILELFTPSAIELPSLGFQKSNQKPLSLAFGFFNPRKKSFKLYTLFYEYMMKRYPNWKHIIVASAHSGDDINDAALLYRYFDSSSLWIMDYLPNSLLSELISACDIGVAFYPTGIMLNNMAPMSFFAQGKTVITNYGDLTPPIFKKHTLNIDTIKNVDFHNSSKLHLLGEHMKKYYWDNFSWEVFIKKMYKRIDKLKINEY